VKGERQKVKWENRMGKAKGVTQSCVTAGIVLLLVLVLVTLSLSLSLSSGMGGDKEKEKE
jgi:hypothetical protein